MTARPNDEDRATPRQLTYLRRLADRAGQTFAYPRTKAEASAEIGRLKNAEASTGIERRAERKAIARQMQERPEDSSAVRQHEVAGYGSTATWSQRS